MVAWPAGKRHTARVEHLPRVLLGGFQPEPAMPGKDPICCLAQLIRSAGSEPQACQQHEQPGRQCGPWCC